MADIDSLMSSILAATPESVAAPLTWQEKIQGPARSLVSGATFGFGDELEASLGEMLGQGSYDDMLGMIRGERERYAKKNPGVTTALEMGGSLAVPVGKIGSIFKNAPAGLSLFSKGPVQAIATGALQGAGYANEGERLKGAATGAAIGGATGAITEGLSRFFSRPNLQADRLITSAYGVPQQAIKKAAAVADDLIEDELPLVATLKQYESAGVINAANDVSENIVNLAGKEKEAMAGLLPILKAADKALPADKAVFELAEELPGLATKKLPFEPKRALAFIASRSGSANEDAAAALGDELKSLLSRDIKTGTIAELQKAKVGLNYRFGANDNPYKPDMIKALRSDIRAEIERRVNAGALAGLLPEEYAGKVRELNNFFGKTRELKDIFKHNLYKQYGGDVVEDVVGLQKTTGGAGTGILSTANTGNPLPAIMALASQAAKIPEAKSELGQAFRSTAPLLELASEGFGALPGRVPTAAILAQNKQEAPERNEVSELLQSILAAQPSKKKMSDEAIKPSAVGDVDAVDTATATDSAVDLDALVNAVIGQESGGNPKAIGYETPETKRQGARALGLMQIMPKTAADIARELGVKDYDLFDPETNRKFGRYYLSKMLERFNNDPELALTAYHSGPDTVARLLKETGGSSLADIIHELGPAGQKYAKGVLSRYA